MKTYVMAGALTIMALLLVAGNASAAVVSFDENGHGSWDGASLTWGIGFPPDTPTDPNTLYYNLGPFIPGDMGVTSGDVMVMEADGSISDLLRFEDDGTRVYVYSDRDYDHGVPELADVGIPHVWLNILNVPEEGTEDGWNGITYTPTDGQPGYLYGGEEPIPVTYCFTSDVPEPATLSLLAVGGLAALIRRRK